MRVTVAEVSAAALTSDGRTQFASRPLQGGLTRPVAAVITELRRALDEPVAVVVFDVTGVLRTDADARVVSVLIEPRRPLQPRRHLWLEESLQVRAAHVRGGHNALGQELFSLDEDALLRLAEDVGDGAHIVVSAAGAPGNGDHERRAAEVLRGALAPASITESRSFYGDSLLVREYTAVLNALLGASAERIASDLADAVTTSAGEKARALVATNEGGSTPLTRLPITPVHAFRAEIASEMLGAALLGGRSDGRVIVAHAGTVRIAEFISGLPAVVSRTSLPDGTSLASSFAHVVPLTQLLLSGSGEPPVTVLVRGAEDALVPFGLTPAVTTDHDLVALGAAVAPMSYWHNRVVRVTSAADVAQALADGEGTARANLVAAGADPGHVHIPESRVLATTYGEAQMVRIRVRGVAETAPRPCRRAPIGARHDTSPAQRRRHRAPVHGSDVRRPHDRTRQLPAVSRHGR
ncbi:hypothetical protein [Microbacterium sp. dk485]|uniref:hypothetical protein n=1 Tax=Microbacterium sp. dk485 TaxID=2560021 RepID=UPI0014309D8E|nr:hypothetical protein [Microbacterium sp. dk485]